MSQPTEFVCEAYQFAADTGTLSLRYAFDSGQSFAERIVFPCVDRTLTAEEATALDRVFRLLLLGCGVSYYKAFAPARLRCAAFPLDAATAAFFTEFYVKGLAEFSYRNGIDLASRLRIEDAAIPAPQAIVVRLPRCTCVPVGGGKDSIVTIECLKRAGEPLVLFALGDAAPIAATIRAAALPEIRVMRRLDPALIELNHAGALNGHVPITGILSLIVVACAIICGFDAIAMSNEHSASAPNIVTDVVEVNHQYSKSFEFERALGTYLASHVVRGVSYFSFLRPLTEVAIARRFACFTNYMPIFRSCNAAYRQASEQRATAWCCDCPKCRFVYLALAPFVPRQRLVTVFGHDMLNDLAQVEGYSELCGLALHKPFECVGEIEESATVMHALAEHSDWHDAAVVRILGSRLSSAGIASLLAWRGPHLVPERYQVMLDACG